MTYDELPYGYPTITNEWPREDALFVAKVRLKLHLRDGLPPWFQFKNGIDNVMEGWEHGTLVRDTAEWHTLTLTSDDLDILDDWYDIEFDPDYEPTFWVFKSAVGLLKKYLD